MGIGDKIRELRKEKNLSQLELARLAGISNTYLSDIEVGRTFPSLKVIVSVSKVLEIDCSELIKEINN